MSTRLTTCAAVQLKILLATVRDNYPVYGTNKNAPNYNQCWKLPVENMRIVLFQIPAFIKASVIFATASSKQETIPGTLLKPENMLQPNRIALPLK